MSGLISLLIRNKKQIPMKMPKCERDDCRFRQGVSMSTLAYYVPVYDKNGVNLNPDGNTTTSNLECLTCGKRWYARTRYNETIHDEIK